MVLMKTFDVRLNGEWIEAILFKIGDEVKNEYGDTGIVESTEDGGLFVNVDWNKNDGLRIGRCWIANSLEIRRTNQ